MQKAVRDARALVTKRAGAAARKRRAKVGLVLVALAVGGAAVAASVLAPTKVREVEKAMSSMVPALTGSDAGAPEVAPARASVAPSAQGARPVPGTRSKVAPRGHGVR